MINKAILKGKYTLSDMSIDIQSSTSAQCLKESQKIQNFLFLWRIFTVDSASPTQSSSRLSIIMAIRKRATGSNLTILKDQRLPKQTMRNPQNLGFQIYFNSMGSKKK